MSSSQSEDENEVDPRVKGELDALNQATDDVNKYENEISEERIKFKRLLNDATQQLTNLGKKYGKTIERARPYYDVMKEVKQAESALQRAIHNFQKSNGIYRAAKETISLAEQRLSEFGEQKVDMAWQEMLNIQTIKVMEAEKDRTRSVKLHEQATKRFEFLSKKAKKLKSKHKNSTAKTQSYFETKEKLELNLQKQRHRVDAVQENIKDAKRRYKDALKNLEKISLEIHEQRKDSRLMSMMNERVEGDGSESPDENLVAMAKESQLDVVGLKSYDDITELENELEEFSLEDETDEEDYSSSEEGSISSECSSHPSPTTPNGRGLSLRRMKSHHSQISNTSIDENSVTTNDTSSKIKRSKKTRKVVKQDSLPENQVFCEVIQKKKNDSSSVERTYDTLHGTNNVVTSQTKGRDEDSDYDIFDDLC